MTVERVVESVRTAAPRWVAVSRAADPVLAAAVGDVASTVEIPALRGRTIWAARPAPFAVVEQPNWWGRLETMPAEPYVVLDHRTEATEFRPQGEWEERVRFARRVARTLGVLPGVRLAHGDPEAPWFVALLPVLATEVVARLHEDGLVGVAPLRPTRPELPGGVRVHLDADEPGSLAVCVASLRNILESRGVP